MSEQGQAFRVPVAHPPYNLPGEYAKGGCHNLNFSIDFSLCCPLRPHLNIVCFYVHLLCSFVCFLELFILLGCEQEVPVYVYNRILRIQKLRLVV